MANRPIAICFITLNALGFAGCSSNNSVKGTAVQICEQWQPILPSRKDQLTDETARQIAGNNAANQTWCKTSPPAVKIAKATP